MLISHRGVEHNIYGEAPFLGARVGAVGCSRGCLGCFNQHLIDTQVQVEELDDLIHRVMRNPFDEGIILGGLEWTEQPTQMLMLIDKALVAGLKVMLYTGMTKEEYDKLFPYRPIWIKYGQYQEGSEPHEMYGVKLASLNQWVEKCFGKCEKPQER